MSNKVIMLVRGLPLLTAWPLAGWAAAGTLGPAAGASWRELHGAGTPTGPETVASAVVLVAAAALALTWCWGAASLVVCVGDALRTGSHGPSTRAGVLRPRLARLLVAVVLGSSLTAPAASAEGTTSPSRPDLPALLDGLRVPERLLGVVAADPASRTAGTSPQQRGPHGRHRVRPGDTLWAVAAERLPDAGSAADVDRQWRRIYRLNRAAIGPDPDLIRPGTVLILPSPGPDPGEQR